MSVPPQQMPPGGPMPPGMPASPGAFPGTPSGGASAPPNPSPAAAPMMSPSMPQGQQAGSRVDVMMATKLLERCIPAFGITSPEGKAVLSALKTLGGAFGESEQKTQELMPAELRHIMMQMAGPGMPANPPGAATAAAGPPPGLSG